VRRIVQGIRKSYWLRSGTLSLLQRFSIALFGFFSFVILVRLLSVPDFGVWVLYTSFIAMVELLQGGFIKNPLTRKFLSTEPSDHYAIASAALLVNIMLFGVIAAAVAALAAPVSVWMDAPILEPLCWLYVFNSFFYTFFLHYTTLHEAHLNFKASFWAYFVQKALFFSYLLVVLFLRDSIAVSLIDLAIVQIVAMAISSGVSIWLARNYLVHRIRWNQNHLLEILNHGKYSFGTNVSSVLLNNIDSWMLGSMLSPAAVAVYNPALRITRLVEIPMQSVSAITYPKLVQKGVSASLSNAKHLYEQSVAIILAVMTPVVVIAIVFADPIVELIAGSDYEEAATVLQITMLYGLLGPFNRQFGITLDAIGKARLTFYFVIASALVNTVLNFLMIQRFGVIGAAYATTATHVLDVCFRQLFLRHVLGTNFLEIMQKTWAWYQLGVHRFISLRTKR
jgi:O-antigen/teichoic acid export membrane protein